MTAGPVRRHAGRPHRTCCNGTDGATQPAPSSSRTTEYRPSLYYTSRKPTHGHLREAFVVAVEPIGSDRPEEVVRAKAVRAPGKATA